MTSHETWQSCYIWQLSFPFLYLLLLASSSPLCPYLRHSPCPFPFLFPCPFPSSPGALLWHLHAWADSEGTYVYACVQILKYTIQSHSMTRLEACEFGLRECRCPQLCPRAGVKLAPQQHQEDWQPMHYPGSLQNNQVKIHDRTKHGWMKYTVPGYTSWCLTVGPSGTCQVAQSLHPWALPE